MRLLADANIEAAIVHWLQPDRITGCSGCELRIEPRSPTERRSLELTEVPADCPQHFLVAFFLIWFPWYPENPGILSKRWGDNGLNHYTGAILR